MADNGKYATLKSLQHHQLLQQKVFSTQQEIERAIAQLAHVNPILKSVCQSIQASLNFDFVAISLVFPETQTIETVCGTGIAAQWSNQCRHYLEPNPQIRDIQADVYFTHHTEIIRGADGRFDSWIYQRYDHKNLVRIFTPIFLIKDKHGQVCDNWFNPSQLHVVSNITGEAGHRIVLSAQPYEHSYSIQVIGTVEAGYFITDSQVEDVSPTINLKLAEDFIAIVAEKTKEIYYPLPARILDLIAKKVGNVLDANAVTIELSTNNGDWQSAKMETTTGYIDYSAYQIDIAAEKAYLTQRALRKKQPHVRYYHRHQKQDISHLQDTNTLTIAIYPFSFDEIQGLIFIECIGKSPVICKQNGWLNLYLQQIAQTIWYATTYAQQNVQTNQLTNLHHFTEGLTQISEPNQLFRQIAWETLHILAADIVSIYEYEQKWQRLITPPDIAGRLICPEQMQTELNVDDVPQKLIDSGENIYTSDLEANFVFSDSSFSRREKIQSTAGILLKIGDEIVGTMFINYRRKHYFGDTQKQLIETLASSAAIAIKNQRWLGSWLDALNDIDLKIITTTEKGKLLDWIVERAVNATNANFAAIRLVNKINQTLETRTFYPRDGVQTSGKHLSRMSEGITGWVASHRQPQLVNNVSQDQRYRAFFPNIGSELCVPLIDKNGYLLGVLNVESHKKNAFNPRDLKMLEMVAGLAVVGLQNVKNKERVTKAEGMVKLGDFAGALVHRMNNKVGAIRQFAQDILEDNFDNENFVYRHKLERILKNAKIVLSEADRVQNWSYSYKGSKSNDLVKIDELFFQQILQRLEIPEHIQTDIQIVSNLERIHCVKMQLINVFETLIQNAIDAMKSDGKLSISAQYIQNNLDRWVEIRVRDTGEGIPEETKHRVFEVGYTTKGNDNGHMGMGLWLSKFYIESLGGEIILNNEVIEGTEIIVILPVNNK